MITNAGAIFVGPGPRFHWATTARAALMSCRPEGVPVTPRD